MKLSEYEKEKQDEKETLAQSIRSSVHVIAGTFAASLAGMPVDLAATTGMLTEFISLRGKLKMQRMITFTDSFMKFIKECNPNIDTKYMQSDDFSDLFEDILVKVAKTKSEEKLKRFRNILINQESDKIEVDKAKRYIRFVNDMENQQINLLSKWLKFGNERKKYKNKREKLNDKIKEKTPLANAKLSDMSSLDSNLKKLDQWYKNYTKRLHNYYDTFEEGDFHYLSTDLLSKGLISTGTGTGSHFGRESLNMYNVTISGNNFINFIENHNAKIV